MCEFPNGERVCSKTYRDNMRERNATTPGAKGITQQNASYHHITHKLRGLLV